MKVEPAILSVGLLLVTSLLAEQPLATDQDKIVARIFDRKIARKEIEPSEEFRKREEMLHPNQNWADWTIKHRNMNLVSWIWKPLREQFVKEQKIEVTEHDLDEFTDAKMVGQSNAAKETLLRDQERLLKQEGLTRERREDLEQSIKTLKEDLTMSDDERRGIIRRVGKHVVEMWKINQVLYRTYGGTVVREDTEIGRAHV